MSIVQAVAAGVGALIIAVTIWQLAKRGIPESNGDTIGSGWDGGGSDGSGWGGHG